VASLIFAGCAPGVRLSRDLRQSPNTQPAGLIPGGWDQVAVLRPDSQVVVTLMDGEQIEGAFRTLGPDDLRLADSAGMEFGVARSNIRRIVARDERDSLLNGALIGAGIGLGAAAIILAAAGSADGYVLASAKWGAPLLLSAVGGMIGVFIDRAHRDDQVVYIRP
jgi:hypothetical protein